jgi:hypothetical protein
MSGPIDAINDGKSWIKLHRSLLESPVFTNDGLFRLWSFILLSANWRDRKVLIPGTLSEIVVPRGSLVTGRFALHAKLYPARDENGRLIRHEHVPHQTTVWRRLVCLRDMKCITITSLLSKCSLISVINYDTYQNNNEACAQVSAQVDAQVTLRSRSGDAQVTLTPKEFKNLRIEEREEKSDIFAFEEIEEESLQKAIDGHGAALEAIGAAGVFKVGPSRECREWFEIYPEHRRVNIRDCIVQFEATIEEIKAGKKCDREAAVKWLMAHTIEFSKSWKGKHPDFCWSARNFLDGNWKIKKESWQEPKSNSKPRPKVQPLNGRKMI